MDWAMYGRRTLSSCVRSFSCVRSLSSHSALFRSSLRHEIRLLGKNAERLDSEFAVGEFDINCLP